MAAKKEKKELANILILGTSGAGKSTLINTIIGKNVAKVSVGSHGTEKMTPYVSEDLNFQLIDSRGFEYSFWNTKKAVKDLRSWIKEGLKDEKPRIHMLWFCVDATSKRFTKQTIKTLEEVKKEWPDIPIIVVLTKSFFVAEDDDNIEMVKNTFAKVAKKTGMPTAIIPVLAEAPKGENISSRGIDELIRVTEDNLEEAIRDSEEVVQKYGLKMKRIKAQSLTLGAASAASVVGAVPIDFPDAYVLMPLETGLVTGITKIYNLDQSKDYSKNLISRIIEAGTVGIFAKAIIGKLKNIPGLVNVAADVINAIVAGSLVFSIGEATVLVMEKLNSGDIDSDDLKWVDQIVENSMGSVLKTVTKIVSEQNGKINIQTILKVLFDKEAKKA